MTKKTFAPTITDVAQAVGVSTITVSRYINGVSYVSAEKRKKIQAAINKLGYRQNQAARVLKGLRSRMIGLVIPDLSDHFFGKCASAVESYAYAQGYVTVIVTSKHGKDIPEEEVSMLMGQHVAGILVVPSIDNESLRQFSEQNVPIVALDRPLEGFAADEVVVENMGGAQTAVNHLIGHGHKRIACVGYDREIYSIQHRVFGYTAAMQAAGLKPDVHDKLATLEEVLALVRQWKRRQDRPTAVFSLNNVSTRYLLQALRAEKFRIPEELALIGFDELELSELLSPPLTVVRQPAASLGTQSARILFERIAMTGQTNTDFGVKLVLPVEFVVRQSCGCKGDAAS